MTKIAAPHDNRLFTPDHTGARPPRPRLAFACIALALGCGQPTGVPSETGFDEETGAQTSGASNCGAAEPDNFADCVSYFDPGAGSDYNHAQIESVLGRPGGSLDVVSLGCGGTMVVEFDEPIVRDVPGPDFIVFENPFAGFPEPGEISVSEDGVQWHTFECHVDTLEGCAGASETLALPGVELNPTDPATAGGDAFDLAQLGINEARYVRIVDRSVEYWGPQDADYCDPGQGGKGGFDLDAVAVVGPGD